MKRALVLDDAPAVRSLVRKALEPSSLEVFEAENGYAGLQWVEQSGLPDIIVVDVNMPIINGIEFCDRISKMPGASKVTLVVLTTEVNASLKEQAKKSGVKFWVLKPPTQERLSKMINMILEAPAEER
jgi:two-component system chemotaxis response regulator CheY